MPKIDVIQVAQLVINWGGNEIKTNTYNLDARTLKNIDKMILTKINKVVSYLLE